eukprot:m.33511 g.33511  ORF g.33511 m.33511 type:complete len:80 (-) comp9635_c0_seq1:1037-1276(-)
MPPLLFEQNTSEPFHLSLLGSCELFLFYFNLFLLFFSFEATHSFTALNRIVVCSRMNNPALPTYFTTLYFAKGTDSRKA